MIPYVITLVFVLWTSLYQPIFLSAIAAWSGFIAPPLDLSKVSLSFSSLLFQVPCHNLFKCLQALVPPPSTAPAPVSALLSSSLKEVDSFSLGYSSTIELWFWFYQPASYWSCLHLLSSPSHQPSLLFLLCPNLAADFTHDLSPTICLVPVKLECTTNNFCRLLHQQKSYLCWLMLFYANELS